MKFALNQMTAPGLGYAAFLDLAQALGVTGVEVRNDLVADAAGLAAIGAFLNDAVQRALATRRDEASAAMHGTDGAA